MTKTTPATLALCAALLLLTGCSAPQEATLNDELGSPETDAYLEANAESLAASYGIENPPEIEAIRLISLDEWASTQISCLAEEGYEVKPSADGQGVQYPQFEEEALVTGLNLAIYTCELRYPVAPRYMQPLTEEQLGRLYAYRSEDLVDCLAQQGIDVETAPPSKEVFIQSNGDWSPYSNVALTDQQIRDLPTECPQIPEDLWG